MHVPLFFLRNLLGYTFITTLTRADLFLLGSIAQLFLEPIDPDGNNVWSTENEGVISITRKSENNDPFRWGMPPGLGRPFRPRGPRLPGMPRDPLGRDQPEETVKKISGLERVNYKITEVNGDRVTVRKDYQFVTQDDERLPYLILKGVGTFVFDQKFGMPVTMTYRATITTNDEDGSSSIPLNVSYELRDPTEVKRQREETRARIAEQNRKQEEKRTVPNVENVDKAIAAVESQSMTIHVVGPMRELSELAIVSEKRDKVIEIANQHMEYDNDFVAGTAAEILAKWATRVHIELLKEFVLERNFNYRKAKKIAVTRLIEFDEQEYFPRIIEEMEQSSFRYELKAILIAAGPKMEQPILDTFDKFSDDLPRQHLLEVLGAVGTQKSVKLLEDLEQNDHRMKYAAQSALTEIRKR
jgi:hypothetical protein